jgi:lipopolysaccharide biosynthesis regulator YciM
MKLFYSLVCLILLTNIVFAETSIRGLDGYQDYKIDAVKNARIHNNLGNIYFDENNYNAALGEYKIAYDLTKNTKASSVYLYNMARCMIETGNYKTAQNMLEDIIQKGCVNITYYETLVDCYIKQNIHQEKLKKYLSNEKNPYNRIIAGLIYLKSDQKTNAKIIFDEFINDNPDMIISEDIRRILRSI